MRAALSCGIVRVLTRRQFFLSSHRQEPEDQFATRNPTCPLTADQPHRNEGIQIARQRALGAAVRVVELNAEARKILSEDWARDRQRNRVEVKTGAGRRDVVLMPQLGRLLREHRVASPHCRDADYVFAAPDGRGRDHRSSSRGVERAVERAKLGDGISSHSFRHTFASVLIVGLRLDPVRIARQLGHTNPSFTQDTYAHLFEQARHANELRDQLEHGFGHLLDVNVVSTGAGDEAPPRPTAVAGVTPIRGQ
jgi:integrase